MLRHNKGLSLLTQRKGQVKNKKCRKRNSNQRMSIYESPLNSHIAMNMNTNVDSLQKEILLDNLKHRYKQSLTGNYFSFFWHTVRSLLQYY